MDKNKLLKQWKKWLLELLEEDISDISFFEEIDAENLDSSRLFYDKYLKPFIVEKLDKLEEELRVKFISEIANKDDEVPTVSKVLNEANFRAHPKVFFPLDRTPEEI